MPRSWPCGWPSWAPPITADYDGDPPLLVGVLKGAMLFMSDLCRAIELPVDVDFMAVSSYGSATRTSGVVRIVKDLDAELTDRHVLVVEDIVDSGLTLNYLRRYLLARRPASVEVCALLVKEGEQRVGARPALRRLHHPLGFVVGYGLDAAERYRNLRGVHVLRPDGRGRCLTMAVDVLRVQAAVAEILAAIGEDPARDGLVDTPRRVAAMYEELFAGLAEEPGRHLTVTFAADHDEMVMVRDIPFASLCEHHLVPFIGRAHVAYIPATTAGSPGCPSWPAWSTATPGACRSKSG